MRGYTLTYVQRRILVVVPLFLLAAAVLSDALFSLPEEIADFLGILLLAALAWAFRPGTSPDETPESSVRTPARAAAARGSGRLTRDEWIDVALYAAVLAAAAVAIRFADGAAEVLVLALFLFGIGLVRGRSSSLDRDLPPMQLSLLLYGVFLLLVDYVPHVDYWFGRAASAISAGASALIPGSVSLGASYLGLSMVVLFLFYLLAVAVFADDARVLPKALGAALACVLLGAAYAAIWMWMSASSVAAELGVLAPFAGEYDYRVLLFLLLLVPTIPFRASTTLREPQSESGRWTTAIALAGAILLGLSTLALGLDLSGGQVRERVVILDPGDIEEDLPVFGRYGLRDIGLFGLLPHYLEGRGFDPHVVDSVTEESLDDAAILVVINLQEKLDAEEKRAAWDFVREGGSLLVLGDHTGREAIREPSNDLLEPVAISLNFDSTIPFRSGWLAGYDKRPHAILRGVDDEEILINIGASLEAVPPARAVIVGRDGFSDDGDPANTSDGYLGDMAFGSGERVGDVVLVAEADYGDGTVLVFGDTTLIQNPTIARGFEFIDRLFIWLSSEPGAASWPAVTYLAAVLMVFAAAGVAAYARNAATVVALSAAAVLAALAIVGLTAAARAPEPAPFAARYAVIDGSHFETGKLDASHESVGGLAVNLLRNGYVPFISRDLSEELLEGADILVLPAPSTSFDSAEVDRLGAFVERGGLLVITAGLDTPHGASALLDSFGFNVQNVPLGRVETRWQGRPVNLWNAWPIEYRGTGETEVLAEAWDYPLMVYESRGDGGVLVVGDSSFLLNKNLEDVDAYDEQNILFIRRFLEEFDRARQAGGTLGDTDA
jgi:hypothetical protein